MAAEPGIPGLYPPLFPEWVRIGRAMKATGLCWKTLIRSERLGLVKFNRQPGLGRTIQTHDLLHSPLLSLRMAAARLKIKPRVLRRFAEGIERARPHPPEMKYRFVLRYFSLAAVRVLRSRAPRRIRLTIRYELSERSCWGGQIAKMPWRRLMVFVDAPGHGRL